MLNCQHHISWVRPVEGGLHQCILCYQVVTRKDVYPRLEDLTDDIRRRWDAHEATRPAEPAAAEAAAPKAPAAKPSPSTATPTPTATATATATTTATTAPTAPEEREIRPERAPRPPAPPPPLAADPRSGG